MPEETVMPDTVVPGYGVPPDADTADGTLGDRLARSTAPRPAWMPADADDSVPNVARIYDAALGGYHNFAVDREFLERSEQAMPGISLLAHANRAYLGRVVRYLAGQGVRQFLDIGSGIPAQGNVHEAARRIIPDTRVAYVDIDPVAVSYGQLILADDPLAGAVRGDLRRPGEILTDPTVRQLIDFTEPVAVLLIAVLHFIPDGDDPARLIRDLIDAVPSGSYVAVSHWTRPGGDDDIGGLFDRTPTVLTARDPERLGELLTGLEPVPPGIVPITRWHPDTDDGDVPRQSITLGVVARKP